MGVDQPKALEAIRLEHTPQARKIIAVMNDTADWKTRAEIAQQLRKSRLNSRYSSLPDRLSANGLIENNDHDYPARIGIRMSTDYVRNSRTTKLNTPFSVLSVASRNLYRFRLIKGVCKNYELFQ